MELYIFPVNYPLILKQEKFQKGGFKAEARQALANLKMVLDAAGVDKSAVLQCRVYIPDVAYWPQLNEEEYAAFWRT